MRGTNARRTQLRNVPMLAGCTDRELDQIGRLAEQSAVRAGEVLVQEGNRGHEFYVLVDGKAEVTVGGHTVAMLGPGDHFGELAALDPEPRTATVRMTTDGEVLEVCQREFYTLLQDSPTLSRKLLLALARRLHEVESGRPS